MTIKQRLLEILREHLNDDLNLDGLPVTILTEEGYLKLLELVRDLVDDPEEGERHEHR